MQKYEKICRNMKKYAVYNLLYKIFLMVTLAQLTICLLELLKFNCK